MRDNTNLFNDSLTMRLNTLERNIKSKSNSFYDSYLGSQVRLIPSLLKIRSSTAESITVE